MKNWELVDYVQPFEEEYEFPRVAIHSESKLREQLNQLRLKQPGVYQLDAPNGESLIISIGGRFAALSWVKPPAAKNYLTATTRNTYADSPVVFTDQGMPETCDPEGLFPADEIIEAVVYFYQTPRLPDWLDWIYWNDITKKWEIKAATNTTPRQPASIQAG